MPEEKTLSFHLPNGEYAKISYFETIVGNPEKATPVLFLHGLTSSKRPLWNTVVQAYIREAEKRNFSARIVAFDWLGHGHSSRGHAYSLELLEEVTVTVLDELNMKAAHLFGMSLGGMAAILVAARRPERVLSIAPQGAPVHPHNWGTLGSFSRKVTRVARPLRPFIPESNRLIAKSAIHLLIRRLKRRLRKSGLIYKNDLRRLMANKLLLETGVEDIRNLSPRAFFAFVRDIMRADLRTLLVDIAEAGTPLRAMDGAAPEHPGLDTLDTVSSLVPRAETLRVPDTGHLATVTQPDLVGQRLVHFHIRNSS